MRVAVYAQGCRLNHAELATIQSQLTQKGCHIVPFTETADVIIINTCTVTENGDKDTRRLVNRAARLSPDAKIALIGCQSQILKDKLLALPNVQWVIGNNNKLEIINLVANYASDQAPVLSTDKIQRRMFTLPVSSQASLHTRANLKVQDGCDFYCSFCIIPFARGPARSRDFDNILSDAAALVSHGHRELVLTGINIGTYADSGHTLTALLDELDSLSNLARVRVSSIEPTTIDDAIFSRLAHATKTKLCRYAHIPLQSGCDATLKRMRRKYTLADYHAQINKIIAWCPAACIGTDIIVGFPGETDDEFETTYATIDALPLAYCHVFSYSVRSLAKSQTLPNPVNPITIQSRSKRLRALSAKKTEAYAKTFLGQSETVLLEQPKTHNAIPGWVGHTDTFLTVWIPGTAHSRHDLVRVTLQTYDCSTQRLIGAVS